jgi:hypothetical protein
MRCQFWQVISKPPRIQVGFADTPSQPIFRFASRRRVHPTGRGCFAKAMPVNEQTVIVNSAIAVALMIARRCGNIQLKFELSIETVKKAAFPTRQSWRKNGHQAAFEIIVTIFINK